MSGVQTVTMAPTPAIGPVGPLNFPIDAAMLSLPAAQQPNQPTPGLAIPFYSTIGTGYSFINAGDQIPLHVHADNNNHVSIVLVGNVTYGVQNSDGSITSVDLPVGSVIQVPLNVAHSFTAANPGAVILNVPSAAVLLASALTALNAIAPQFSALNTAIQAAIASLSALPAGQG